MTKVRQLVQKDFYSKHLQRSFQQEKETFIVAAAITMKRNAGDPFPFAT